MAVNDTQAWRGLAILPWTQFTYNFRLSPVFAVPPSIQLDGCSGVTIPPDITSLNASSTFIERGMISASETST